jgi:hypothetical protein
MENNKLMAIPKCPVHGTQLVWCSALSTYYPMCATRYLCTEPGCRAQAIIPSPMLTVKHGKWYEKLGDEGSVSCEIIVREY